MKKWKSREQEISDIVAMHSYKCKKCGHKELIRFNSNKTICSHCHNYIFKTELDEFKFRINQLIRK